MSETQHACKDCKWYGGGRFGEGRLCAIQFCNTSFDPILGVRKVTMNFFCHDQNKDGRCKYFKPSLKARFWQCMGVEYER
jgi:hypothetical protein